MQHKKIKVKPRSQVKRRATQHKPSKMNVSIDDCKNFLESLFSQNKSYDSIKKEANLYKSRIDDYQIYSSFIKIFYQLAKEKGFYNPEANHTLQKTWASILGNKRKLTKQERIAKSKAAAAAKVRRLKEERRKALAEERKKHPFFQWVTFIPTPMGGQNK